MKATVYAVPSSLNASVKISASRSDGFVTSSRTATMAVTKLAAPVEHLDASMAHCWHPHWTKLSSSLWKESRCLLCSLASRDRYFPRLKARATFSDACLKSKSIFQWIHSDSHGVLIFCICCRCERFLSSFKPIHPSVAFRRVFLEDLAWTWTLKTRALHISRIQICEKNAFIT